MLGYITVAVALALACRLLTQGWPSSTLPLGPLAPGPCRGMSLVDARHKPREHGWISEWDDEQVHVLHCL